MYKVGSPVFEVSELDSSYKAPETEKDLVHIKMYVGNRFDPDTGVEVAAYRIQKYNPTDFKNFENSAIRLGYKYCFLHTPKGFKSKFEEIV